MVTCPHGHRNPNDNEFCVERGAPLAPPATASPEQAPSTADASAEDKPGAELVPTQPLPPKAATGITLSRAQLIGAGLTLAVVVVALLGLVLLGGRGGKSSAANTTQAAVVTRIVTVVVPQAAQATVAAVTPAPTASPTPSPSPSPSPTPTPQSISSRFGAVTDTTNCVQSPADTAATVTSLSAGTVVSFDQLIQQTGGVLWYHTSEQNCWVRAKNEDSVQVRGDKTQALSVAIKYLPAGSILYQADWSNGINGWPATYGWKVLNGLLLNDGTNTEGGSWKGNWVAAPYVLDGIPDYAVEVEAQFVSEPDCGSFRIVLRSAYQLGFSQCGDSSIGIVSRNRDTIAGKAFGIDTNWHTYRAEVSGNNVRFMLDGTLIVSATDNRFLDPGMVGLVDDRVQLTIRSFKIIKR